MWIALVLLAAFPLPGDEPPSFERDVRPILARNCTICHNAKKVDDPDVSGGLALDSFDAALRGTKKHRVIEKGKSTESELIRRINEEDEDQRMPQGDDPLSASDRDVIRRWIDSGAVRGEPTRKEHADVAGRPSIRRRGPRLDVAIAANRKGKPDAAILKIGPLSPVSSLAFRPDGRLLAVGIAGRVVVWDIDDRAPVASLDVPGPVHALAFSRDGRRLAVGAGKPAETGVVRVYSVPDGTRLHDFAGHTDAVYALVFRPDGAQLASAGFDATVRLWDLVNDRPAGVFKGHSDFVYELAYSRDGRSVFSASKDRSIKRFDATTLKGLRTYSDHEADVFALAMKPDGSGFVSAGEEPVLRWWPLDGERPTRKIGGHSGSVFAVAFSGDGRSLISASGDGSVRLWEGRTGTFQRTLPGPSDWQYAAALCYDGSRAAAGGWDGLVRVWDARSGKIVATFVQPTGSWASVTASGEIAGASEIMATIRWKNGEK